MFITRMQIMPTINKYHNQIRENNTKFKVIYFYYTVLFINFDNLKKQKNSKRLKYFCLVSGVADNELI